MSRCSGTALPSHTGSAKARRGGPRAALLSFEELIDGLCEDDVAGLSAQLGLDETDADGAAAAASAAEGGSAMDVTDDRDDRADAAAS